MVTESSLVNEQIKLMGWLKNGICSMSDFRNLICLVASDTNIFYILILVNIKFCNWHYNCKLEANHFDEPYVCMHITLLNNMIALLMAE